MACFQRFRRGKVKIVAEKPQLHGGAISGESFRR
jgi:hypothetical protein